MRPAIEALCEARQPLLIGVRHHSAILARALPTLLDAFKPEAILIELPSDLGNWLDYVADEETLAPIAIAAVSPSGGMFFYPLADFSPELVAIRWAKRHSVPLIACDLSLELSSGLSSSLQPPTYADRVAQADAGALERWLTLAGASDTGDLWQRIVEAPGSDGDAESIRRAALAFGLAIRMATPNIETRDLVREAAMRTAIRNASTRSAAIIGSFHAPALLRSVVEESTASDAELLLDIQKRADQEAHANGPTSKGKPNGSGLGVSLVPYSFDQLDERSGYPAGVRDPVWHQRILLAQNRDEMDRAAMELVLGICRELRRSRHVAGTPDATEAVRMMRDLARLRRLPCPGRNEMIEAIETCLVHGDRLGRGRAVAAAAEAVLIGRHAGRVTSRAPRCGLAVDIESTLASLKLPGAESLDANAPKRTQSPYRSRSTNVTMGNEKEFSLDVLREPRDRARAVVLRRLNAANVPYARRVDTGQTGWRENLVERWIVGWQAGTSATIESLSRWGVTLEQVVAGRVPRLTRSAEDAIEMPLPSTILEQLEIAAECGLIGLTRESLMLINDEFQQTASISQLVATATLMMKLRLGMFPGLPTSDDALWPPIVHKFEYLDALVDPKRLLEIGLERLEGLSGSSDTSDVAALNDFVGWYSGESGAVELEATPLPQVNVDAGLERLAHWCRKTLKEGSDLMRGATAGALAGLDRMPAAEMASLQLGWIDGATGGEGRKRLRRLLTGLTFTLLSRMQSDAVWLRGFNHAIAGMDDTLFLERLPTLRGGFANLSPADRNRILEVQLAELPERGSAIESSVTEKEQGGVSEHEASDRMADRRAADLAGRAAVFELLPEFARDWLGEGALNEGSASVEPSRDTNDEFNVDAHITHARGEIRLADRWRMILGVNPETKSSSVIGAVTALDQLYGRGRGEGSQGELSAKKRAGAGGGTEAPQPTMAEWADDLEALFGSDVCQEVLGEAAMAGKPGAVELLDVDSVQPSVELLQQVLALAGSVPEARLAKLRQIASRITKQLAEELAVRLAPALSGLSTPRPTRRKNRRLNLARTIRNNLANCQRRPDGRATIIAERLIFNAPAKREMDWHITFVVDVSGSMTASVVYSALVAAIFDALPALSVRFITFSTEVIDLSGHVRDPLSLLLDVQVGGGTHIGLGLRAARVGVKVPTRSIVVLVSDFEEGVSIGEMLAEVRALVDSGVKCLGLASLDDTGVARFHQGYAKMLAAAGMSVAAVSPEKLASWVGNQIRNG